MSDESTENTGNPGVRCPKCGFASSDREICDACGVVFAKVRAREIEEEGMAASGVFEPPYPPYVPPKRTNLLSRSVLLLAVVAVLSMLYYGSNPPVYIRDVLIELPNEKELTGNEQGVLVEFWASWCAPCKTFAPILESIEGEYGERLRMIRVNVDENQKLASRMKVKAVPTVLIFDKEGKLRKRLEGARRKTALQQQIDEALGITQVSAPAGSPKDDSSTTSPL